MALLYFIHGHLPQHRLHRLFVHLPMTFWLANVVCDLLYWMDGNSVFAVISYYCILLGLLGVVLSGPMSLIEYLDTPSGTRAKHVASLQMSLNLFSTILFTVNFFSRHGLEGGIPNRVTRGELIMSVFSVTLVGISGFLGGLLIHEKDQERRSNFRRAA